MGFLLDTNIILEILLEQEKSPDCKLFMTNNYNNYSLSDFTIHSIGVILFKKKRFDLYSQFFEDLIKDTAILKLNPDTYKELDNIAQHFNLDFDDAYQFALSKVNNLEIVTLDKDFLKVKNEIGVHFL